MYSQEVLAQSIVVSVQQTLKIAGKLINFQVYILAGMQLTEGRHFQCVGDNAHRKPTLLYRIDGEADAIQTDRTLAGDKTGEVPFCIKQKPF